MENRAEREAGVSGRRKLVGTGMRVAAEIVCEESTGKT